jgi:uncharacterized protein YaeQ
MALGATVHHFEIELSDVDRAVYETLEMRVARHPSESLPYLLTRTLAYCLAYAPGIAFSKGLSTTEEPALWVKDDAGTVVTWIEIGTPSAARLHKASKASPHVMVFTQHDPELLRRETRKSPVHRAETIEVYALPPALLAALEPLIERRLKMQVLRTEGQLYVTIGQKTVEGALERVSLGP